jgi:hypothetical protein
MCVVGHWVGRQLVGCYSHTQPLLSSAQPCPAWGAEVYGGALIIEVTGVAWGVLGYRTSPHGWPRRSRSQAGYAQ